MNNTQYTQRTPSRPSYAHKHPLSTLSHTPCQYYHTGDVVLSGEAFGYISHLCIAEPLDPLRTPSLTGTPPLTHNNTNNNTKTTSQPSLGHDNPKQVLSNDSTVQSSTCVRVLAMMDNNNKVNNPHVPGASCSSTINSTTNDTPTVNADINTITNDTAITPPTTPPLPPPLPSLWSFAPHVSSSSHHWQTLALHVLRMHIDHTLCMRVEAGYGPQHLNELRRCTVAFVGFPMLRGGATGDALVCGGGFCGVL